MVNHLRYLGYVLTHKWFVFLAGRLLGVPLLRLLTHDWTKFTPAEWPAYVAYRPYFGRAQEAPPEIAAAFKAAWDHHWTNNPHHPEYWTGGEEGAMLTGMPETYVREWVADMYGAGMAQGKPDIAGWFREHGARRELHPITRERVERVMAELVEHQQAGRL